MNAKRSKGDSVKSSRKRSSMPTLDLRKEAPLVRGFVCESLAEYGEKHAEPPTGLVLFYAMQNGFLELQLWTDPDFEPFADENHAWAREMKTPHWRRHHDDWSRSTT